MRGYSVFSILFTVAILFFQSAEAHTSQAVFAKFPNKYFIETGSYQGDGIRMALNTGRFQTIYSIELFPAFYKKCSRLFASNPSVKLYLGDSSDVLPIILKEIDAPATFWLDGHFSGPGTGKGNTNTPLMAELENIRQHSIKTHTLLIDDVRLFGTAEFDFVKLDDVIAKILEINPDYQISYEDGYCRNDVLVAKIQR